MRILALITARGGSKRLPGKNLLPLGGKPMLLWSIEAAQAAGGIADILVSTDDAAIADVARAAGALVPWLRPAALASDTAASIDVALHALDWYEAAHGAVDGLMLLQPTSPFRRSATIRAAVQAFALHGCRPVIGVSPAASHPAWCFRITPEGLAPWGAGEGEGLPARSQDLPPAYAVNGAMYLVEPRQLRAARSFFPPGAVPLLMEDPAEALDIDTAYDFRVAECFAAIFGDNHALR